MANLLTFSRLLLALPVAWALSDSEFLPAWALALCLFAAIVSDYIDGKSHGPLAQRLPAVRFLIMQQIFFS